MIALLHKIPGILHCENRVGIKLLTMLLIEDFSNAQRRTIMAHIASEREKIIAFAEKIQEIFNNQILGDEDSPAQWRLPMYEQGENVGIAWTIIGLERLLITFSY
jgi:hypothetical protein